MNLTIPPPNVLQAYSALGAALLLVVLFALSVLCQIFPGPKLKRLTLVIGVILILDAGLFLFLKYSH